MVDILTRESKGSALTFTEMDANWTALKEAVDDRVIHSVYADQVLADSPVAYWRFNDDYTDTSYADSSGNGYALSPVNGMMTPVPGGVVNDSDRAMYTSGARYTSLPTDLQSAWPTSNNLTIEAITKISPKNLPNYAPIFCMGTALSSQANEIRLCALSGGTIKPYFQITVGTTAYTVQSDAFLPLSVWTHMACTYDGTTMKLYMNGALVGSLATSITVPLTTRAYGGVVADEFTASQAVDYPCTSSIDEVALYNTCLSAERIAEHARYMRGATS